MRAVAVIRPFAIPVQQLLRLLILIAVLAFFAGVQRVADLFAGGLDDLFGIIVLECGNFHLGGVIAAGAGIVFIPANFGAGGRLRIVVYQVVFQRKQLHLSGVIAAGAGIVFLPANFGAGGRFGVVMHQLVFQRRQFHLGGVSAALALAGFVGIPADLGAGGSLCVMVHHVVVVRVRSIIWVYISIRSLVVAVVAVCVVHGRSNAGGCGLKAHANGALNEPMCAHLSFRFVADGAAKPVVFVVRMPVLPRRECMCAVVLPAAGAACSQRNAGRAAVAGAACGVDRIAAVTLAVADMLTVVTPGLPCAPVVRPVFTVGHKTRSTYRNFRASGFVLGCIYAPMILCKLIIAAVTVQRMVIFFSFAYFKGIPFAIVAVQPDMRSHRRGCYKEQRNRQETCNQPFFHVFLLLKFLKTL